MHASMDEELFPRKRAGTPQAELVTQACREAEETIRSAATRPEAERAAEDACRRFASGCASDVLVTFVKLHAGEMVRRYWGT